MARLQRDPAAATREAVWRDIRARHPRLREAIVADARVTARYRGERYEFAGPLDTALQIATAGLGERRLPRPGALSR